jgi:hypothetical protein
MAERSIKLLFPLLLMLYAGHEAYVWKGKGEKWEGKPRRFRNLGTFHSSTIQWFDQSPEVFAYSASREK